jgi:peptidoglycan-associated lipoprotein
MKTTKLIYPLILVLAVTLAATGCKRKPVGASPLPGTTPRPVADNNNYNTKPMEADNGGATGIGTAPIDTFEGMIKDPKALAAFTVHFAYDSAVVRKAEQSKLQSVAQALAADPSTKLLIEGNCDERGTPEYNRALGERRALAAREALAKLGVDPMRIRTISYGKDKPVDAGHDAAAWTQNRRDDFVLLHPNTGGATPAPIGGS